MRHTSRPEFDAAVASTFPNVRLRRKEHHHGWTDTIELGWLQIQLTAYEKPARKVKPGQLEIQLFGVRPSTGNSTHLLQRWLVTGLPEFRQALEKDLKPRLLGLSAALLQVCGLETGMEPHLGPPTEARKRTLKEDIDDETLGALEKLWE